MTEYSYLHVAMHGHFDNRLAVKYAFNTDDSEWMASLPDPDAIVRNFMSARECYVLWRNEFGHYFSLITTDPLDPATGRVMVTLMVDNGCMLPGRAVFTALSGLKKTFLEDRILTDDAVARALAQASVPAEPIELAAWQTKPVDDNADIEPMCYRTYLSTRELEGVFSFPDQPEYDRYYYDIIINATASLRPGIAIDRLTTPIRKVYSIVCPEGITASSPTAEEGKTVTLTFTKEGFADRKEQIVAGVPTAYAIYDGSMVKIKNPAGRTMGFIRKVRLTVKNSKGGLVNGYTVSVNDRPVNTMEPFIELTETDLQPGRRVEIQVASNNFHPLVKNYEAAELSKAEEIELILVPVEQGITLRLVFGEGRVFEQQISLEKNTPEYSQLHSGNFHGFRAQKMVTPHGGEMYNVDVRAAGRPVAPTFDNVAPDRNKPRPERVVPHFENVSTPAAESAKTSAPEPVNIEKAETPDLRPAAKPAEAPAPAAVDAEDDFIEEPTGMSAGTKVIIGAVTVILLIAGAVFFLLRTSDPADETGVPMTGTPVTEAAAPGMDGDVAPAEAKMPVAPLTPEEQADVDYLNSSKYWKLSDLKSDKYRQLFELIRQGDITGMANHDYFAVEGRCTATEPTRIIEMAWGAYGSDNQRGNEITLRKSIGKDERIDVHKLYEDLARRMPKEPNAAPRPRR
nr:hypothetical protein [Bacteroides sp.]